MSNMGIPVRRSTREEALERIVRMSVNATNQKDIYAWAHRELKTIREGLEEQLPNELLEEKAFKAFGWYRKKGDCNTDKPGVFANLIARAYQDARGYPEYTGIEVRAEVTRKKGGGSGSNSYNFEAVFGERIGLINDTVYKTEFSFIYSHEQESGQLNGEKFVSEQLDTLRSLLLGKINTSTDEIVIEGQSLIIRSKKPGE